MQSIHGHRGARGLYPENSIEGFEYAAALGIDAIELDVISSGDQQLMVSHEPWPNPLTCLTADEKAINPANLSNHYQETTPQIQSYIVGKQHDHQFPSQQNIRCYKPTLAEVVQHTIPSGIWYNIEVKSYPLWYGTYCPPPKEYAQRVSDTITSLKITQKCMIQSFDPAFLNALHALEKNIPIGLLVEGEIDTDRQLAQLNFKPDYFNPAFSLLNEKIVSDLHQKRIQVLAWVVNTKEDITKMAKMGIDGIISDYPHLVKKTLNSIQKIP